MDPVSAFLDGPRARSAFLLRAVLEPPWSMRIQDRAPLAVIVVTSGRAWLGADDGDPVELVEGSIAVVRGPDPYVVADDPSTPPTIVIDPGEVCRTPDGVSLVDEYRRGVRTWGNAADGGTQLLVGTYLTDGDVSAMLLDALDQFVVLGPDVWRSPLVDVLAHEITRDEVGQQTVLDRLLDLLLVDALRAAFTLGLVSAPGWLRSTDDPLIGEAVALIQHEPAQRWTVSRLARAVGVSRPVFARRFHEAVGEPPIAFLTTWRMAMAADLLREPGATVAGVGAAVGYDSPFTFSAAFKRHHGVSPRHYRDGALSA